MNTLSVTGSSGLIGSEVVGHFASQGWAVHGIDNNQRADFFGPAGDTSWNRRRLISTYPAFKHHELDIRDREQILKCVNELRPTLVVHAAAQPSFIHWTLPGSSRLSMRIRAAQRSTTSVGAAPTVARFSKRSSESKISAGKNGVRTCRSKP
jgi:nucleoside-diphosphate-sugar epimerase